MKEKHFEESAVSPNSEAGIKKILLVDDSSTSRMTARMLLSGHESYVLTSACDGQEGVEKAIDELPNLILMDIEMPRMNGIEACKVLKQNKAKYGTAGICNGGGGASALVLENVD